MRAIHLCDELEPVPTADLCLKHNLGIEAQSFFDPQYIIDNPGAIDVYRNLLEGIPQRSFHGPFAELVAGSMDPMIRDVVRHRYEETVTVAQQLDISEIVLHHGFFPHAGIPKYWSKRFVAFWKDFLIDKSPTLRFHIENVFENDPNMIADDLDAISDTRVDACLDVGHVNCFAKGSPVKWVRALGSRIGYVHLHNNHGDADSHAALDDGTIDMLDLCLALEEHAPSAVWALEMKPALQPQSLAWLESNGFWQDPTKS